ncbi:hypothetical protein [Haemophilus parahaemolyticus]|uniref:hypothetical protein n=1 Tax=Haemophilus parahaemolyticus TaxID=735 RepID=UPI0028E3860C|nr:hypothetical protein [Haemophilus parahaemolyticus]
MISTLDALKMQLRQAIIQLEQAEKSLDKGQTEYVKVYVHNAKGILMKLGITF